SVQPLHVLHIWDHKHTQQRDLHQELLTQPEVVSRQCVRELVLTGAPEGDGTVALKKVAPSPRASGLAARALHRAAYMLSCRQYESLVRRELQSRRADV